MKHLTKIAIAAGLLIGASTAALAVERGGVLTYGRYADSLFLDPVLQRRQRRHLDPVEPLRHAASADR